MIKKTPIIFILLFIIASCASNKQISEISKQMAIYNVLESEHVGIAGETTEQYKRFQKLKEIATTEELLYLLDDTNTVVKGYSSWALADRKYKDLNGILTKFIESKDSVTTMNGCIVSSDNLASSFYHRVLYNENSPKDSLFYVNQIKIMDSIIINKFPDYDWLLLLRALENNNTNHNNYNAIRKLAFEKQNKYALEALGKYQKINDIDEFIALGNKSFKAISHFPDSKFWGMLNSYKDNPKTLDYFLAVSSFKNIDSQKLLSSIYTGLSEKEVESLCEALAANYTSLYFDLLCNIWEKHKTIDITIAELLIAEDSKRATNSFTKGLLNNKEPRFLEFWYNYGTKNSIMGLMLQCIIDNDKSALVEVCRSGIENTTFMDLSTILDYIEKYRLTELTDNLLAVLDQKKYPFEIFHISEVLFSFQDNGTNQKLVKILESKEDIWNRGNWADHFTKLFKENKVIIN